MNFTENTKAELESNLARLRIIREKNRAEQRSVSELHRKISDDIHAIEMLLEIPDKSTIDIGLETPEETADRGQLSRCGSATKRSRY